VLQVTLPFRGFAFATAGDGGPVAVTNPDDDAVVFFPNVARRSVDGAVTKRVGRTPAGVAHKRVDDKGYFPVACPGAGTTDPRPAGKILRCAQG
jgi:hypothetical protein